MRYHPLAAVLGLALMCSPLPGAAEAEQPAPSPAATETPDAFQQTLLQMESTIAKLRATGNPAERQRLLREQARSLHQAMRLAGPMGPGAVRPPRGAGPGMPTRNMWGPGSRMWGPGERPGPKRAGVAAPEQPGHRRRQGAPYAEMEQRLALMQQRMDEQQRVLDEILQYREPIEELLQQAGCRPIG